MFFKQIISGGDRNYGYLIGCENTKLAALVDPSPDPIPAYNELNKHGLTPIYVINTHGHYDHTAGNAFFQEKLDTKSVTHASDYDGDIKVSDGELLIVGELRLQFIYTPGHTMDSICIRVEKELMTGDTLFVGKIGGTSSREKALLEFDSLKKLMALPHDIRVWPGHNYGVRPSSTIGEELQTNPFILRLNNFDDFMWLKDHWADYKKEHGIT